MAENSGVTFQVYGITKDRLSKALEGIKVDFPEGLTISLEGEFPKIEIGVRYTNGEENEKYKTVLEQTIQRIKKRLEDLPLVEGHKSLVEILLDEMEERGLTLACAESCTGGLIGKLITDVPGSSKVFLGSLVTYSNSSKISLLGINQRDIEKHGAVSKPVAEAMAVGARGKFSAHYSISATGIAGPSGGAPEKPVGTVYIGIAGPKQVRVKRFLFTGNREQVRFLTAIYALELIRRLVTERPLNLVF